MQMKSTLSLEKAGEHMRRKMANLRDIAAEQMRDLRMLTRDRVEVGAGRYIAKEGTRCGVVYLVESGWVFRSRTMSAGQRQIINYAIAGDLLCADSVMFGASGFDLIARTPVSLFRIDVPTHAALIERYRGLAASLAWTAGQEESVLAERVVSLGRRDSLQKLAHALCELSERLSVIGKMSVDIIEAPLNQEDFADLLGISVIHVNRTFRKLSEENIAEYRKGRIELLDRKRLAEIAVFNRAYLHFE
jgi:CRP-like cAMP-binding protein